MPTPLEANIKEIRAYTRQHPELFACPFFLYDLHLEPSATEKPIVVMGINPGWPKKDKDVPRGTEETSLHDFHKEYGKPRTDLQWTKDIETFCQTLNVVQTELFFWCTNSSADIDRQVGPLERSSHLQFCTRMNRALLDAHLPKAVVFPGLSYAALAARCFGLVHVETVRDNSSNLIFHYRDEQRPWIFTKHWSFRYGFPPHQKRQIRDYIARVLALP